MLPHLVDVTLITAPAGLSVIVNDVAVSGTVVSWGGLRAACGRAEADRHGGASLVLLVLVGCGSAQPHDRDARGGRAGFVAVWFRNGVNETGVELLGPGQVDLRWQIVLPK